eukprot:GHVT01088514.1.p1 GENE.GHVT01088514.1~~GHVT01088514.1.p1  ORF type:complete len:339 (-),score=24.69 GHVT01088514.1:305-1321(-)
MLKELQKIWKFSDDDMFRFLAETEQLNDRVRYAKFADVAVRLMESLRPSSLQDKNASDSAHGDVHIWGLTLAEFHAALASSASEAATWSSNKSRGAVAAWFSGPAFGITRSVLNVLSFQLPRDTGGFLSLNKESAGRAWDILQKLAHLPYFQNSPPKLQMAQFIEDICKSKDVQLAGRLPSTVIVELLSSAMLGLSRWQLCGVLAAIPKDDNGRITYTSVANLIASRLTGSIAPVPVIVPPQVRVDPQDASDFSEMIRPILSSSANGSLGLADYKTRLAGSDLDPDEQQALLIGTPRDGEGQYAVSRLSVSELWIIVKQVRLCHYSLIRSHDEHGIEE